MLATDGPWIKETPFTCHKATRKAPLWVENKALRAVKNGPPQSGYSNRREIQTDEQIKKGKSVRSYHNYAIRIMLSFSDTHVALLVVSATFGERHVSCVIKKAAKSAVLYSTEAEKLVYLVLTVAELQDPLDEIILTDYASFGSIKC
ncbi:hypothetical protein Tco_0397133 [Tanacetum coccineum]